MNQAEEIRRLRGMAAWARAGIRSGKLDQDDYRRYTQIVYDYEQAAEELEKQNAQPV